MSQHNPLAGLLGQYGSDEDSDNETPVPKSKSVTVQNDTNKSATTVHPPPVAHCPWSACYDNDSGYTYYWNQKTNEVTWEAPPDYLLALKLAERKLQDTSSTEVTAEEWQLYQQALAEKQSVQTKVQTAQSKVPVVQNKVATNNSKNVPKKNLNKPTKVTKNAVNGKNAKKRPSSDSEDEKIEPITTYCRSDSESDTETISPEKPAPPVPLKPKNLHKKHKSKNSKTNREFGPMLPPNQNYTVPIGPELPPELQNEVQSPVIQSAAIQSPIIQLPVVESSVIQSPVIQSPVIQLPVIQTPVIQSPVISAVNSPKEEGTSTPTESEKDDEDMLLKKLRDKAKVLENLGGEIPNEIKKYIKEDRSSREESPACSVASTPKLDTNIDDLLEEIEKKELPKIKTKINKKPSSGTSSPKTLDLGTTTPPLETKPLFPSSNSEQMSLFPSAGNMETIEEKPEPTNEVAPEPVTEKKPNIYLMDEPIEKTNKKKLRISKAVLPERKKLEVPSYTTKYSQFIEGFAGERTGLGFSNADEETAPKKTISYGKGLMFTKGEVLHEDKSEEMNDIIDGLDAKLKFLNQLQPYQMTPLQEMTVQMQTLQAAYENNALTRSYYRRWLDAAMESLKKLEQSATPQGWTCRFNRSEVRYEYVRDCDGFVQHEFPSDGDDMDISTTPPHPGIQEKEVCEVTQPPLPPFSPPPPPQWGPDPPPPGCEPEHVPHTNNITEPKKEITDELMSFYNDIAEIEKVCPPTPPTISRSSTPDAKELPVKVAEKIVESNMAEPKMATKRHGSEEKTIKEAKIKKKSKVKISSSVGLKHKTVSSLVAKWQQVAEEIGSD